MIYPAGQRTLAEHHAIHEERLKDNEVLLLVRRRRYATANTASAPTSDRISTDNSLKAPTAQEIQAATKDIAVPARPQTPTPSPQQPVTFNNHARHSTLLHQDDIDFPESAVDFQLELRKIIISLISVMATLLHGNEDADLICQEMHARIKNRLKAVSTKVIEGTQYTYPPPAELECSPQGIVNGLMEVRKREFRPNPKALQSLRDLGYQDEQIIKALRANKNGKDAAAEWLAAGKADSAIDQDDVEGLDRTSHLFTALVNAPTIRLGLNSPKTLLAFLNILESPASANTWLGDVDTAPVLSSIFKIYHAEKHAEPILSD